MCHMQGQLEELFGSGKNHEEVNNFKISFTLEMQMISTYVGTRSYF